MTMLPFTRDSESLACPFWESDPSGYPGCVNIRFHSAGGKKQHIRDYHSVAMSSRGLKIWGDASLQSFIAHPHTNGTPGEAEVTSASGGELAGSIRPAGLTQNYDISGFQLAWVCRSEDERDAALISLDILYSENHRSFPLPLEDPCIHYILGKIGEFNVVITWINEKNYFIRGAMMSFLCAFPSLKSIILVGTGDIANLKLNLTAGDVVVGTRGRLVEYTWNSTSQLYQRTGSHNHESHPLELAFSSIEDKWVGRGLDRLGRLADFWWKEPDISTEFKIHEGQISSSDYDPSLFRDIQQFPDKDRNDVLCIDNAVYSDSFKGVPLLPIWGLSVGRDESADLGLKRRNAVLAAASVAREVLLNLELSDLHDEEPIKDIHPLRVRRRDKMPAVLGEGTTDKLIEIPQSHLPSASNCVTVTGMASDSGYASLTNINDSSSSCGRPVANQSISTSRDIDEETDYSEASSVPTWTKDAYISEMAEALAEEIVSINASEGPISRITSALPNLLKAFSLKVGSIGLTQMNRDIMYFIHKNRRDIVTSIQTKLIEKRKQESQTQTPTQQSSEASADLPNESTEKSSSMTVVEKMRLWDSLSQSVADPQTTELEKTGFDYSGAFADRATIAEEMEDKMDIEDDTGPSFPQLAVYKDFIFKSAAYDWLIGTLRRDLLLGVIDADAMCAIREKVLGYLQTSNKVSKKRAAETFELTFSIRWDPILFLKEQQYKEESRDAIEQAVTITGSPWDAQAVSCAEYLSQTWPLNGRYILEMIQDLICQPQTSDGRGPSDCVLPDGTILAAKLTGSKLSVKTIGTGYSIAEIGQQLAWIGAALGRPRMDAGVTTYFPHISRILMRDPAMAMPADLSSRNYQSWLYECDIDYRTCQHEWASMYSTQPKFELNGQCWHSMFRSPVVVEGFPIPLRPIKDTGLEVPIHIATSLLQTDSVEEFRGITFVKGFSSMLTAIQQKDGVMFWHLTADPQGDRVSYNNGLFHFDGAGTIRSDIKQLRHIVGWCPKARFYAGAIDANYDIEPSSLATAETTNFGSLGVNISKGKLVIGPQVAIGVKDIPLAVSKVKNGVVSIIKWISLKHFVFWDEEDKRGWLVNGASALLHLLRGSLFQDTTGQLKSICSFRWDSLNESSAPHTATSAVEVLLNPLNRNQEIYRDEDGSFTVHDRIKELCWSLEKMFDSRAGIVDSSCGLRQRGGVVLQGWDFSDLAEGRDDIHSRALELQAAGTGWAELVQKLGAVVLFGRGFGEIVRPIETFICDPWSKLPSGKNYLAAAGYDIREIMRMGSRQKVCSVPIKFSGDLLWHPSGNIFGKCECSDVNPSENNGHVQLLSLFGHSDRPFSQNSAFQITEDSAIIFGYDNDANDNGLSRPRPEATDLRVQDFKAPSQASSDTFKDSGVGSSIGYGCEDYTIAILSALPKEMLAVRALFDISHDPADMRVSHVDGNHYAFGRMGQHNIVAVCLPYGRYGTNSAGHVVSDLKRSFQNMRLCFLVGIGGGVPSPEHDIRLGDVVVGIPKGIHGGVIQHDLGKILKDDFERTGLLHSPPSFILTAISNLESRPKSRSFSRDSELQVLINSILENNPEYRFPGVEHDNLRICSTEPDHMICRRCDEQLRSVPKVHYGLIASGNQVIKNAGTRDRLYDDHGVLCIEMEAAGVVNACPCLVVRGISDYADGDKNDRWQEYASASAAAYVKMLLSVVRSMEDDQEDLYARPLKRTGSQVDNPAVSKRQRTLGL